MWQNWGADTDKDYSYIFISSKINFPREFTSSGWLQEIDIPISFSYVPIYKLALKKIR